MSQGVVITPSGSVLRGDYDGYGSLGDHNSTYDLAVGDCNTVWHRAYRLAAGAPTQYLGESTRAADQGWVFEDGAHDLAEPHHQQPTP